MNHIVAKKVYKETEKLSLFAQEQASKEMDNIEHAKDFCELTALSDVIPMEGTDEPYYRLKFGNYRYLLYYDIENETLRVLSLTHRKDTYKKFIFHGEDEFLQAGVIFHVVQ